MADFGYGRLQELFSMTHTYLKWLFYVEIVSISNYYLLFFACQGHVVFYQLLGTAQQEAMSSQQFEHWCLSLSEPCQLQGLLVSLFLSVGNRHCCKSLLLGKGKYVRKVNQITVYYLAESPSVPQFRSVARQDPMIQIM